MPSIQQVLYPIQLATVGGVIPVALSSVQGGGFNFALTMTANATLANPAGMAGCVGANGVIIITQNSASAYTLAFGSAWVNAQATSAATISTTLGAVNLLSFQVVSATSIWYTLNTAGVA